jgi:hypothetical protein
VSIASEKYAAALEVLAEIGTPVEIGGRSVQAIVTSLQHSADRFGQGGYQELYDGEVKVLKTSIDRAPEVGERLSYDGDQYIIARVRKPHDCPYVILTISVP